MLLIGESMLSFLWGTGFQQPSCPVWILQFIEQNQTRDQEGCCLRDKEQGGQGMFGMRALSLLILHLGCETKLKKKEDFLDDLPSAGQQRVVRAMDPSTHVACSIGL